MIALDINQTKLFRLLQDIFGESRVIPQIRLKALCGGVLPLVSEFRLDKVDSNQHENLKCLFTVVDKDDEPRMVIDFDAKDSVEIDVYEFNKQEIVKKYLSEVGVQYLLIGFREFEDILDNSKDDTLATCLNSKIGVKV